MNTNITTLCNLVAPKPNKVATSSGKNGAVEGQQPADEYMNTKGTTDKNSAKANKTEKSGFDETLRKKMNPETSHEPHDSDHKKEKSISKKEKHRDSQSISNQDCENHVAHEKENRSSNNPDFIELKHNTEVNTETQTSLDVDTSNGSNIHQPSASKEDTVVTIDVPTPPPSLKLVETANPKVITPEMSISKGEKNNFSPVLPQKNNDPLKSVSTSENNGDSKPHKSTPETPTSNQNKISFETNPQNHSKKGGNADTFASPTQENNVKNEFIEPENKENTFFNKISQSSLEKSILPNKPISPAIEAKEFAQVQSSIPSQDNNLQERNPDIPAQSQTPTEDNNIPFSRMSAYRTNAPMEQITEKHKNSIENGGSERKLNTHEPSSVSIIDTSVDKQPVSNEPVKSIGNTISGSSVARQIQESVHSDYRPGTQQIVIRLDPPDLGRVIIRFIEQKNGITGVLEVDKAGTKHEIQQFLPGIIQNLENSNVPIKRLEVVLNDQPQYDTPDENSASHHGSYEQQNTPNHGSFTNAASYNEWVENSNYIQNATDPQIELTDKSINMLI